MAVETDAFRSVLSRYGERVPRGGARSPDRRYTFDFPQLARDAVVAVEHLQTIPEIDAGSIGLSGYSQGGWVAPLAASLSDVRFVLVHYGSIDPPTEEARVETRNTLRTRGVDGAALSEVDELTTAAVQVVGSS